MFKKIILILALICIIVLPACGVGGTYTDNGYFYLPDYGAYGEAEWTEYNAYMQIADTQIEANKAGIGAEAIEDIVGAMTTGNTETFITVTYQDATADVDFVVPVKDEDNMASDSATFLCTQQSIKAYADTLHALQYLKTEIDSLSEVETIYSKNILDTTELNTFTELQTLVADKTLVNEEDICTIDANWVNTTNPWADNEVANNITIDLATLATTITVTDNEATNENNPLCFVAGADPDGGSLGIETDGDLLYNPSTGTLTVTAIASALTGNATTCTTASAGDAAIDFFGAGVDAVTDATTCTNIEGTLLSIATGTLNAAIPEDHINATMLKDGNSPADEDIYSYELTGATGHWYSRAEVGIGTATSITDDLIVKADFANEDWGDMTVTANVVSLNANSVDSAEYTDASIDHEHLAPDVITGLVEVTSADLDMMIIADQSDSWALKKVDMGEVRGAGGGYTNLTEFVSQTAWRVFYSNAAGDVTELALGADGTYLESNGAAAAPTFTTPAGAGNVSTSGSPVDNDFAKFVSATDIEGRSYLETRNDLEMYTWFPQDYATGAGTSGDPWAGSCIEDAYTAASAGDTIYMRAGYYQLAGTLTIASDKSVNFIGEGINKTIIKTVDLTGFQINAHYTSFRHLTVDGTAQTDGADQCINTTGADYLLITNVEVKNAGYYGLNMNDPNYCMLINIYSHDNYRHGIHAGSDTAGDNCHNTYKNIYAWNNGVDGFDDRGNTKGGSTGNVFDSLHCWNNTRHGIFITYQSNSSLSNSIAHDNTEDGIEIYADDFLISNCSSYSNNIYGIYLRNCDNVSLVNVISKNNGTGAANDAGILVYDAPSTKLSSCRFFDERIASGTDIAFVDGGAGEDTITQTAATFLSEGFVAGKDITITGAGEAGNNDTFTIVSVTAGVINVATASLTAEAAGASVTITHEKLQAYGIYAEGTTSTIEIINCELAPFKTARIKNTVSADIVGVETNTNIKLGDYLWTNYVQITPAGALTLEGTANIEGVDDTEFGYLNGISSFGGTIIDDADASAVRTTLGLVIGTNVEVDLSNEAGLYAVLSDVTLFLEDTIDDTSPELGGELDCGAHSIGFTQHTATGDGATLINWTIGNQHKFTFGAQNETITFTNPSNPCAVRMIVVQDGTGSRTITWSGMTIKWAGGTAPTLTTTANGEDVVSFIWDGTSYYGAATLAFATP